MWQGGYATGAATGCHRHWRRALSRYRPPRVSRGRGEDEQRRDAPSARHRGRDSGVAHPAHGHHRPAGSPAGGCHRRWRRQYGHPRRRLPVGHHRGWHGPDRSPLPRPSVEQDMELARLRGQHECHCRLFRLLRLYRHALHRLLVGPQRHHHGQTPHRVGTERHCRGWRQRVSDALPPERLQVADDSRQPALQALRPGACRTEPGRRCRLPGAGERVVGPAPRRHHHR